MPVQWLAQPTGSWLAKPLASGRTSSPHLISSHKKKQKKEEEAERGEQRREGKLQTHTEQIDEKRHSPSALLVCDTLADNAQSVHSVAGG